MTAFTPAGSTPTPRNTRRRRMLATAGIVLFGASLAAALLTCYAFPKTCGRFT